MTPEQRTCPIRGLLLPLNNLTERFSAWSIRWAAATQLLVVEPQHHIGPQLTTSINREIKYIPKGLPHGDRRTLLARQMKDRIGFVPQNDYLLPNLTGDSHNIYAYQDLILNTHSPVRETLTYAAALRLPSTISKETRGHIVDLTIEELGLSDAADTVIGGFSGLRKGISGGERRRVTIACILVSLPSVIILDEPTSGLDAFSAYQLLLTVSQLAKRNRTIVLSLHQPRSDAFGLFTRILLLSKGDVVYSGLTSKCLPWFKELGEEPEEGTNPLDFLIDISNIEIGDEKRDASRARVQRLVQAWKDRGTAYAAEPLKAQTVQVNAKQAENVGEEQAETIELKRIYSGHSTDHGLRRAGLIAQTRALTSRCVCHDCMILCARPHVHYSIEHSRIPSGTMDRHLASPSSLLSSDYFSAFLFSGSARSTRILVHHPDCLQYISDAY